MGDGATKVIIADDSVTIQRVMRNMLLNMGREFDCLMADGGDIVMELLEQHDDVRLVFLDWNMPVMNGLDCLRAIRARETTKRIPVIMITAEMMLDRVRLALEAGATNYLVKPFDESKLHATVSPLLQ